jgi:GNAT superfamily N-acetyltransferase
MEYKIRRYQHEDAPACCAIITRCLPGMSGLNEAARNFLARKNQPEGLHEEMSGFFTLVVASSDSVVGVGALCGDEIKRVYIDPAHQGSGCGTLLVEHLEDEAKRRGIQELWVESSPNAERFYARLGYTSHGTERFAIDEASFEFVKMSKVLDPVDKHA